MENGLLILEALQVLLIIYPGKYENRNIPVYIFDTVLFSCVIPSFILMAIQGDKAVAYIYELKEDTVVVSKKELTKS